MSSASPAASNIARQAAAKAVEEFALGEIPVFYFNDHAYALYSWTIAKERGVITDRSSLVHVDSHHDLFPHVGSLDDLSPDEVAGAIARDEVDCANFILPAIEEGLIGKMHWVAPCWEYDDDFDPPMKLKGRLYRQHYHLDFMAHPSQRRKLEETLKHATRVAKVPYTIQSDLSGIPQHPSLILDIDLDYFSTTRRFEHPHDGVTAVRQHMLGTWHHKDLDRLLASREPGYNGYVASDAEVLTRVDGFGAQLKASGLRPHLITIAASDEDNIYTPGDQVDLILQRLWDRLEEIYVP